VKRLLILLALPFLGAKGCGTSDCDKAREVVAAVCGSMPASQECAAAQVALEAACQPKPTPPPPPPTTTLPTPPSTLPPPPTTTTTTTLPPAPEPQGVLPESCKSAEVYVGMNYYGNGLDTSVRWRGSEACCRDLGHQNTSSDCHAEGFPQRQAAELEALGGACNIFQASVDGKAWFRCEDNRDAPLSCDHFGNTTKRDDPQTPDVYEGEPKVCAKQAGAFGFNAGFFAIAHGKGYVRACRPDGGGCSSPRAVDF
jgi:hypothetical protein